jgi:F-type H+-transporting ATPase subunit b
MEWWKWRLTPHPWRYQNHGDHCDPRNQPVPLFANVLNLGVLIFLLVRFGRKPLGESLDKRKSRIMAEVERAREIQKSAQTRLKRYEDELDHLDERLASLRANYALEGESEEKRLLEDMRETRDRLLADAEFRVQQESKQARDEMSRRALEEALSAAERLLETTVSAADHERMAEDYLDQIAETLAAHRSEGRGGKA